MFLEQLFEPESQQETDFTPYVSDEETLMKELLAEERLREHTRDRQATPVAQGTGEEAVLKELDPCGRGSGGGMQLLQRLHQSTNCLHVFLLFHLICQGLLQVGCNQKAEGRGKWKLQYPESAFLGTARSREGGEQV